MIIEYPQTVPEKCKCMIAQEKFLLSCYSFHAIIQASESTILKLFLFCNASGIFVQFVFFSRVCVCVCACVCVCVRVCVFLCLRVGLSVCVHACVRACMCACVGVQAFTHVHFCTYVYVY